jgi:hypothetical protein
MNIFFSEKQQDKIDLRLHAEHNISFTALFSNLHANYLCYLSVCRRRGYVFISELQADYCSYDNGKSVIARQNWERHAIISRQKISCTFYIPIKSS